MKNSVEKTQLDVGSQWIKGEQRGLEVCSSDSQSGGQSFESRSDHLLNMFSGVQHLGHKIMKPINCLLPVSLNACYVPFRLFD